MKARFDAKSGEVLVCELSGKVVMRLAPAEAVALSQQLAHEGGKGLVGRARDLRVGDVLDLARHVFRK